MTDPGEIRALDLHLGAVRRLASADGFPEPSALTVDDRFVVVPSNLNGGTVTLASQAGGPPITIELGQSLLDVDAGPTTS